MFLVNRTDETVPVTGQAGKILAGTAGPDGDGVVLAPRRVAVLRLPLTS